jgi:hypothetical protein
VAASGLSPDMVLGCGGGARDRLGFLVGWCRAEVAQGGSGWLWRSQDQGLSTKMLGLGFIAQR